MKKLFILILALLAISFAKAQFTTLELVFTAIDGADHIQLDSIKVMNRTQGGDTMLYWPDTVLVLDLKAGITEFNNAGESLQVFQNYPNPVTDQTTISMYIPNKDKVSITITDMMNRVLHKSDEILEKGTHYFLFSPGSGNLFFFTAQWRGMSSSIKIIQTVNHSNGKSILEHLAYNNSSLPLKVVKDVLEFPASIGDELLYIGYANELQSGMLDAPVENKTYPFQFATNIPCPGTPTVTYDGQVYNTIQVYSQCWLKENLNAGTMISWTLNMSDNSFLEKFCYNNEVDSCTKFGGLYQWNEIMQYTTQQGLQGICPPDWHVPTDEEWKVLEGVVDNQYRIGNPQWDLTETYRGFDAGTLLKANSEWLNGGNGTDLFGFSCLPGGYRSSFVELGGIGIMGMWWSSTEFDTNSARYRRLNSEASQVWRDKRPKAVGFGVRCLRN